MATIHKFVDDGAEAYLPFLLAREREIRRRKKKERERGQGQAVVTLVEDEPMEGSYTANFDFGDGIEGELRMVGNQSFIRLTKGGNARSSWIAYPCKIAPVVFESAAHATTPVENRPVVEKIPFVAIPHVPLPEAPHYPPPPTCNKYGYTNITRKGGKYYLYFPGGPIYDEYWNIIGFSPGEEFEVKNPTAEQIADVAAREACVAQHLAYDEAVRAASEAYGRALEQVKAENASIDMQNQAALQVWFSENDAPMVAKKNVECDAWDAPKRPGRKAFMEALFTRVLAEVEAGFTTKWLTKVVLSPDYLPVGPFAPTYFIRIVSSSASFDALEQRTDTFTYSITDPDGKERRVEGSKRDIGSYGPATDCFLLNGDEYQSPFRIYELSNFWLGDPADDMRDMLPSSTSRGRGYLVTGSTPTRQDNKFLFSELNEVALAEAAAFDTSAHPPYITADDCRMLDMAFVNGCQVSIIVLRYMMWDEGANARVPVVGYTDTTSSFVCQSGNCFESNFVSRAPAPRNAANEVWLESVVTITKKDGEWLPPVVVKHPGVFLCPIVVDNTPRENVYEQVTLGIPFAQFPDFVVVVRGMPKAYEPDKSKPDIKLTNGGELGSAFTDTFLSNVKNSVPPKVPPATECTTVAQMRDRIFIEAIKQSNL